MNESDRELLTRIARSLEAQREGKKILGFKLPELVILCVFLVGCGLQYGAFTEIKEQTKWLVVFARNSDLYSTVKEKRLFEQGLPKDGQVTRDYLLQIASKAPGAK